MPPQEASGSPVPLRQTAAEAFQDRFGRLPTVLAAAPGRVNLIGEHIDYNDGFVLPAAIDRQTLFAAAPRNDSRIAIHSLSNGQTLELEAVLPVPRAASGSWENYLRGVLQMLLAEGLAVPGFDAVLASEVPLGSGLSSSAALEVSFATALEGLAGTSLPPARKALLCQQAEHVFAGVPCGIMDQFAAVFGRAGCLLLLDCRSHDIEWIPFPDPNVCLLIANTNIRHALADGEYALRRRQCSEALAILQAVSWRDVDRDRLEDSRNALPGPLYHRAKHVVTEIARTLAAARAIRDADWETTRRLMAESHASLRADYEVSCPELDCLVDIAAPLPGVLGSRMTGGGFGGCTVSLVRREQTRAVTAALREGYFSRTGVEASIFIATPGDGASLLPIPSASQPKASPS